MVTTKLKVLASRPRVVAAEAPMELRRHDYCFTYDGEILVPPAVPCCEADICGCGWGFSGITSARATTWGVVEERNLGEVEAAVRNGEYFRGSEKFAYDFDAFILADIHDINERVHRLPLGTVVGIWTIDMQRYSLFDRTPRTTARIGRVSGGIR